MSSMRVARGPSRALERDARADIERWQARAIPDMSAPIDAEDLVRLLRDLVASVGLDPEIASGFTVNTVHYYRRKDIIDPPDGRTVAARYGIRHLWQIAGARLAGHLGLVTLAEARDAMRGADQSTLMNFLAARVADARARTSMRAMSVSSIDERQIARPLPGSVAPSAANISTATVIGLPDNALVLLPASHAAHRSPEAARELVAALSNALRALHSR